MKKTIDLKNMDCMDFLPAIDNNSVDLVLIDPPYDISHEGKRFRGTPCDFGTWDHGSLDLEVVINECYRVLKPSGTIICFYDLWKIADLKNYMEKSEFSMIRMIEWEKTNPCPINSKVFYLSAVREVALVAVKGSHPTFNSNYDKGIYRYGVARSDFHSTPKNVELFKDLIQKHSNENDLVLDCFSGSGTTALAAKETNRRFVGCEIDSEYYRQSLERIFGTKKKSA